LRQKKSENNTPGRSRSGKMAGDEPGDVFGSGTVVFSVSAPKVAVAETSFVSETLTLARPTVIFANIRDRSAGVVFEIPGVDGRH
jgi:hypothetical protein